MIIDSNRSTDFTDHAWEVMYDIVDSTYFRDKDADIIYSALEKRLKFIPCMYLSCLRIPA